MKQKGLSQETLKLIACVTMLIDHIGATLVLLLYVRTPLDSPEFELIRGIYYGMRLIGRISFPIYCFLLVEGAHHTRNPKKYALRLFIGMLLSEIPFDLAFCGTWMEYKWTLTTPLLGFEPEFNSVMMTLLLGFLMIEVMKRVKGFWKAVVIVPFYIAAELLHTDYAGDGILLIALFALSRGQKHQKLLLLLGMVGMWALSGDSAVYVDNVPIYMDRCKLLSLLPILAYDGRKVTQSKAVQWGFYLFYPVHLTVLLLVAVLKYSYLI